MIDNPPIDALKIIELIGRMRNADLYVIVLMGIAHAQLGLDVVSAQWLRERTTYKQGSISESLTKLASAAWGLVEQPLRYQWRLTVKGMQLSLEVTRVLAESDIKLIESDSAKTRVGHNIHADSRLNRVTSSESESLNTLNTLVTFLESPKSKTLSLTDCYLEALRVGKVFPGSRRKLAPVLAAEGEKFLLHLIAHIAFAFSDECDQKTGAYVYEAVQVRELGNPKFFPPAGYSFEQALLWAQHVGPTNTDETSETVYDTDSEIELLSGEKDDLLPELTEDQALWVTVLDHLRLEMTKQTFQTWIESTSLKRDGDKFIVVVPTPHARAWLENRMKETFKRTLSSHLEMEVTEIYFEVESK